MRKVTEATDAGEARAMVDHLLVLGIEARVHPEGSTEVWVLEDDAVEQARAALAGATPGEESREQAAAIRRARALEAQAQTQRTVELRGRGSGEAPGGLGPLSTMLIVASCLVAAAPWLMPEANPVQSLSIDRWDAIAPLAALRAGEIWRLVTPMLIHFGLLHLVFNMMWLDRLGRQIEARHGTMRMVVLVVVTQCLVSLGQYFVSGPRFGGMSGVNYALFSFVWMHARYDRRYGYALDDQSAAFMLVWFVLCATGIVGPIANVAHAVGFVMGVLFGLPPYLRHLRARADLPDFATGSWAEVNLRGVRGAWRRYGKPYVPFWFLALAVVVAAADLGG